MGGIIKKLISLIIAMVVCGALTVGATANPVEVTLTGEDFNVADYVASYESFTAYDVRWYSENFDCDNAFHDICPGRRSDGSRYTISGYGGTPDSYQSSVCVRDTFNENNGIFFTPGLSGFRRSLPKGERIQVGEGMPYGECYCPVCGGPAFHPRYCRANRSVAYTTTAYRVVPEFTPTAIKLKNCRFSPHDGINSQRKEVV